MPPKIIVDTDVVSYVMKGQTLAHAYARHLQGKLIAGTFVTVGELYNGTDKANWNEERRKKLETALHNFVVIPNDGEICRRYGRLMADCDRRGRRVDFADAWIAACALRHEVPLVTHNSERLQPHS